MYLTEDRMKRAGAILLALAIPGVVYLIIVYLLLPGFASVPMQERLKLSMTTMYTTVFTTYGLIFGLFFAYTELSTIRHKPLYGSRQPVKLVITKKPTKHQNLINAILYGGLAIYMIWFVYQHRSDPEGLIMMFFYLAVYMPLLVMIPLCLVKSRFIFYSDRFKHGIKVFHGYDIGLIQLNEEAATISFKHINTRYQFTPPADQLHQHYESLLRCTGKEFQISE